MYLITFSKQADKALRKMPSNIAQNIVKKIKELSINPDIMKNVKKLTDHPGFRLRSGDWRIIYVINKNEKLIQIVKIKTRGDVYK